MLSPFILRATPHTCVSVWLVIFACFACLFSSMLQVVINERGSTM